LNKNLALAIAGLVAGAFGAASAQEPPAAQPAPDITTQRDVSLSPKQMLDEAEKYLPDGAEGVVRPQAAQRCSRSARCRQRFA
jgi:hypothetical protein